MDLQGIHGVNMAEPRQKWDSDLVAGLQAQAQERESQLQAVSERLNVTQNQTDQGLPAKRQLPWWRRFWRR